MIVIGDVHGCFDTLMALLNQLPHNNICFVGDLIDRGPKSKEVIEFVMKNNFPCVMGNHEEMMLIDVNLWLKNGGRETLKSFENDISEEIKEWVKTLPLIIEFENFLISHSSCFHCWDMNHDLEEFKDNVLWNREFNFKSKLPKGVKNVFGHTPVKEVVQTKEFIIIDGGCVFKNVKGFGNLFAFDLETGKIFKQKNMEV